MPQYIYVLRLVNSKYYVGRTQNVWKRVSQHFDGTRPSQWTRLHRPVELISVYQSGSRFDEDNETKRMMEKYSIDDVRGGSYVRIELPQQQKAVLTRELNTLSNKCFKCGLKGHYANRCKFAQNRNVYSSAKSSRIQQLPQNISNHKNEEQPLIITPPKRPRTIIEIQEEEDEKQFEDILKSKSKLESKPLEKDCEQGNKQRMNIESD